MMCTVVHLVVASSLKFSLSNFRFLSSHPKMVSSFAPNLSKCERVKRSMVLSFSCVEKSLWEIFGAFFLVKLIFHAR